MTEDDNVLKYGHPDMNCNITEDGAPMDGPAAMSASRALDAVRANNKLADMQSPPIPGQVKRNRPQQRQYAQAPQQYAPQPYQQPQQYQQPAQAYAPQPQYQQYAEQPAPVQVPVQYGNAQPGMPPHEMVLANGVYHLWVDLPGCDRTKLGIKYVPGVLTVSGERSLRSEGMAKTARGAKGRKPKVETAVMIPEYLIGKYSFPFYFNIPVDESTITAEFDAGVLHVSMSTRAENGGITISIK